MTDKLPIHLGGHKGKTHLDHGALIYLKKQFKIKTMLDIGCGPAGMVKLAHDNNIDAYGIDGDYNVEKDVDPALITIHDYTKGPSPFNLEVDLVWSVEFLEHVYEEYQEHYMQDFARGQYALITFAPPGKKGHHHVNCNTNDYWIDVFDRYGFTCDLKITEKVKNASTMNVKGKLPTRKSWIKNNGLFFIKR